MLRRPAPAIAWCRQHGTLWSEGDVSCDEAHGGPRHCGRLRHEYRHGMGAGAGRGSLRHKHRLQLRHLQCCHRPVLAPSSGGRAGWRGLRAQQRMSLGHLQPGHPSMQPACPARKSPCNGRSGWSGLCPGRRLQLRHMRPCRARLQAESCRGKSGRDSLRHQCRLPVRQMQRGHRSLHATMSTLEPAMRSPDERQRNPGSRCHSASRQVPALNSQAFLERGGSPCFAQA
jgi:hypothetical protein